MKGPAKAHIHLILYVLCSCLPVSADPVEGICAYSISSQYGPIIRCLYYSSLVISLIFNKHEWLVAGTLGFSMVLSSTATVHAVALAAVRGRGTVDLDIIPVFTLTGVGMLIATPMLIWSKTLREATTSVRLVIFLWIGVMFVGVLASMTSMKALPRPIPCDIRTKLETCDLICNATLPMRGGQSTFFISFSAKDKLSFYSRWLTVMGGFLTPGGVIFAIIRQSPKKMLLDTLRCDPVFKRRLAAFSSLSSLICVSVFYGVFVVQHIVVTELIMLGKHHVPLGANMSAIDQWGPLVGVCFALFGTLIKKGLERVTAVPNGAADIELIACAFCGK